MAKPGRLKRKSDFKKIFDEGKSRGNRILRIRFRENDCDYIRLAFVMSKKLAGAVQRNKIRRVLFEEIRRRSSNLTRSYDVVLFPKEEAVKSGHKTLRDAIYALFMESGLIAK
jgi:ribonuclease P protein component